jgi:hypothetical protein
MTKGEVMTSISRLLISMESQLSMCEFVVVLLLFTGWYRTRRPIHCDHY